jgi:hypothetical protein
MRLAWRLKWSLLRLGIAAFLLYALVADTGARLARLQYASLPEFDYAAEIAFLREQGRFGEALMVADAGMQVQEGQAREALAREREITVRAQGSFLRRASDLGMGALSGRGTSLEGVIGAVAADFFVVGDVRDLVIEGGRLVIDGETDEVILVLSGIGLATTVAPEVDWVPSLLKVAKKTGAMSKGLAEHIVRAARRGHYRELMPMLRDVGRISERASPGGAIRILRHADSPDDVAKLASFVERQPLGAFAIHVAGKEGADIAKGTRKIAGAGDAVLEQTLIKAARKGDAGVGWLRKGGFKAMARPHLLVGIGKALWKGNAEDLAARIAAAIDPRSWWLIPLLGAWVFLELGVLMQRLAVRLAPAADGREAAPVRF